MPKHGEDGRPRKGKPHQGKPGSPTAKRLAAHFVRVSEHTGSSSVQTASADALPAQTASAEVPENKGAKPVKKRDNSPRIPKRDDSPGVLEIDPEYLSQPGRMEYALLLALLLRAGGSAKLTGKELQPEDTEHNIVFARTRDGKGLEITVVSSISGILRSPASLQKEKQWVDKQALSTGYSPAPPAPLGGFPTPHTLAELEERMSKAAANTATQLAAVFETGTTPAETRPLRVTPAEKPKLLQFEEGAVPAKGNATLADLAAQLQVQQESTILAEQAEAIARQERGEE